jgi:xanthine dehydrogenase YagS FAD-binding subunit
MQPFEYASPTSTSEAVKLLSPSWGETEVLAGGTDLLALMKDHVCMPKRVVSLKRLHDLRGIHFAPGKELRVGAMTTYRELIENETVRRNYPALVGAIERIRSEQLRNMGSIGGGMLQRPRDWYFRLGYGLLPELDGKPMIANGDNRYAAIFGNSGSASWVSPSTVAPVLIALGARVALHGPQGARVMELERLFTTPTESGEREHTLRPNEILTEIMVPHHEGTRTALYEVRQKEALDYPLVLAAVALEMHGLTVRRSRVILSQVAPVPWVSHEAESALSGKTVSEETAEAAGKAAVSRATPLSMNRYKLQLTRVAVKRAILEAARGGA